MTKRACMYVILSTNFCKLVSFCTYALGLSSVILPVNDLILPVFHRPRCQLLVEPTLLLSRAHPITLLLVDFIRSLSLPSCLVVVFR